MHPGSSLKASLWVYLMFYKCRSVPVQSVPLHAIQRGGDESVLLKRGKKQTFASVLLTLGMCYFIFAGGHRHDTMLGSKGVSERHIFCQSTHLWTAHTLLVTQRDRA